MPLSPYACENCGFWQRYFAPPPDCPVCTDVRNDLPADGWSWLTATAAEDAYAGRIDRIGEDFYEAVTTPHLGLAGRGWMTVRDGVLVGFEAAPFYSPVMLDEVAALAGETRLAASHVHGYGALWQLQDRLNPSVLAIHKDDLQLTKAFRVTSPFDERLTLAGGMTMIHVGGHYEGQSVLYDEEARRLFCGDMFKIDQDEEGRAVAISTHKAFHKNIPMTHEELRRYRDAIAPLDFTEVCSPFERAEDVGKALCLAVLDRALSEPPAVTHYEVASL